MSFQLPKLNVASSILAARSNFTLRRWNGLLLASAAPADSGAGG